MSKRKLPLERARAIARRYLGLLAPACRRIEIAGSIRRGKSVVGDIEMVAMPEMRAVRDLFGNVADEYSLLDEAIGEYLLQDGARLLKNGARYKQIALPEGVNLDLFIVLPPAQWGVIFTLRTGPGDFSRWVVTPRKQGGALPSNCRVKNGAVWCGREMVAMPEEEDFLRFLGLSGLAPEARKANIRWRVANG